MKNVDLVIIGGGPAGLAAAIEARRHGVEDLLKIVFIWMMWSCPI